MKKAFFGLFVLSILLSSCGPNISEDQQQKLTELTAGVDSIEMQVGAIDSIKISEKIEAFYTRKDFLQKEMKDTLSRELIFKLDAFVQLRKGFGFLRSEYTSIKQEANILKKQLTDLNKDVNNRLIDEDKFKKYYELEKSSFDQLKFAAERLINASKTSIQQYDEKVPMIDSLIAAYKAKVNE